MKRELLQPRQRPPRYIGSYLKERRRPNQAPVASRPSAPPQDDFLKEIPLPPVGLQELWHRGSRKAKQGSGSGKHLEINLSFPKISLPRWRLTGKTKRAVLRVSAAVVCVGILAFGLILGLHQLSHRKPRGKSNLPPIAAPQSASIATSAQAPSSPTYAVILPAGKTIEQLGGWTRVSPPDKDPAYAFTDTVAGTAITVSEQPLPKAFQANPASSLAALADQFGAKDKVVTADGGTAYVGSSAKGPQSVLAVKANTLLLLKSANTISINEWARYINSLQ